MASLFRRRSVIYSFRSCILEKKLVSKSAAAAPAAANGTETVEASVGSVDAGQRLGPAGFWEFGGMGEARHRRRPPSQWRRVYQRLEPPQSRARLVRHSHAIPRRDQGNSDPHYSTSNATTMCSGPVRSIFTPWGTQNSPSNSNWRSGHYPSLLTLILRY